MKIGVDARLLGESLTGIGRYTFEMSKQFVDEFEKDHQFIFYASKKVPITISNRLSDFRFKTSSANSRVERMIWSQTKLPYWANNDQVDLFWGPTHRLPNFLSSKIARVVTVHDLVWKYTPETMRKLSLSVEKHLMPSAISQADLIIADSESTAEGIRETFPNFKDKVRVVHLGVSEMPKSNGLDSMLKLGITKPYILFVGTLEPRKNLARLLESFSNTSDEIKKSVSLVIVGGKGWGNINLDEEIKRCNLGQSVKVLGFVEDNQLSTLYSEALFLAMPSLYEGFGLPILEAMSFGTPVLTSNVSSMPEVLGSGGIVVNPLSVNEMTGAIETLILNNDLRTQLGNNAKIESTKFSWKKAANSAIEIFEEALEIRKSKINSI